MRTAIVGCGFQGRLHLEILQGLEGVEVVALCDTQAERVAELAEAGGVAHRYGDWRELLADHRLDLVVVCTMPDTHREITVAALEAGAHVFCEKPLARDAAEGAAMVAAARRTGRTLTVGFNMRHTDEARAIAEFVGEPRFGRPVCARGYMLADDVPWWGRHYTREVSGGGALASTAVHMLDLLIWLAGGPRPLTATASTARLFPGTRGAGAPSREARDAYDVEDLVFGHVRFEGGFWLTIEGAWVWDRPGWNYGFDLVGELGQARFDPLLLTVDGERVGGGGAEAKGVDFPRSIERQVEGAIGALREGRAPLVTAEEALRVQLVVDALYRAADEGREVPVPTIDEVLES